MGTHHLHIRRTWPKIDTNCNDAFDQYGLIKYLWYNIY